MFKKISTATIALSGLLLSAQASATEVSLEQLVGSLVTQAVSVTKQEISYGVQEAVLTANHNIDMNTDSNQYLAKVTIVDLKNDEPVAIAENDKAE